MSFTSCDIFNVLKIRIALADHGQSGITYISTCLLWEIFFSFIKFLLFLIAHGQQGLLEC